MGPRLSAEERKAKEASERKAYIDNLIADFPPPTEEQARRIVRLLYGVEAPRSGPSEYELEQRRKAQERESALKSAQKAALAMTACDVCNLQPDQHYYNQRSGVGFHEWQPGRAEKLMSPRTPVERREEGFDSPLTV